MVVREATGVGPGLTTELTSLRVFLVAALPEAQPETIAQLVRSARIRVVPPGQQIYTQGDAVPLTIILEGFGAARRTTIEGKELVSGIARSGVLFGWSGLASVSSSVELLALTICKVAQWRGADVRALAMSDAGLAAAAIDSRPGRCTKRSNGSRASCTRTRASGCFGSWRSTETCSLAITRF